MALTKKPLIIGSILVHGAVAFGVYVSGIWHLDQLDPGRHDISLAVMEVAAPQGSPAARELPKIVPKAHKEVPKVIVQPVHIDPVKPEVASVETTATLPGNGLGSGSGSGDNPDGPDKSNGHCVGAACAPPVAAFEEPPTCENGRIHDCYGIPKVLDPHMMKGLRISGETNVVPSDVTKQQMVRDDHLRTVGAFRVCLDAGGAISSITQQGTTKYPDYDATLAAAIRTWRYKPYLLANKGVPACGMVTFVYSIR